MGNDEGSWRVERVSQECKVWGMHKVEIKRVHFIYRLQGFQAKALEEMKLEGRDPMIGKDPE